jgi:hypothetical protein
MKTLDGIEVQDLSGEIKSGWYGEWMPYDTEEEMKEACHYLVLWLKFFPKKIRKKVLQHSEIIIKPAMPHQGVRATVGIKILVGDYE